MLKRLFFIDTESAPRVFGLDVLRALAIIIVVDAHGSVAFKQYYQGSFFRAFIPDGVELFFVLSGFLIGGILIKSYEKSADWSFANIRNFWTRRWFRTLPNYYLILGAIVIANLIALKLSTGAFSSPLRNVLPPYFVFLQNFTHPTPGFFAESWSLAIEEWAYLLLPTALWAFHRFLNGRLSKQQILFGLILTFLVLANGIRLYRAIIIPKELGEQEVRNIVLFRLDAIVYGVLGAYVKHYHAAFWKNRTVAKILFWLGLGIIAFLSLSASIWSLTFYYNHGLLGNYAFYKHSFFTTFMGLSMVMILPLMDGIRTGRGWIARAVTHISLISYSMYLLNLSLIMNFIIDPIPTSSESIGWAKYALFWVLVIGASTLLYKFYERPMTDLRDRVSKKEPKLLNPERVNG
ncbi:acyltransferase family protein [Tellurirhabdus bombi]|uniref:acyltransferase family protein n=1 Tax=Tellurirhabdus bombi TaxID=2907205 RepID=UPI001F42581C|nr:acyltransferase [Tellurirhabdus bombi]